MLKMKKNSGITLVALIVTIIILLILIGISFTLGTDTVEEAKDDLLYSELHIIQQAVVQEYSKIITLGEIDNENMYLGTQISNVNQIDTSLTIGQIPPFSISDSSKPANCYYRLSNTEYNTLNITRVTETYVVNYSTGEVYNETRQIDSNGKLLYVTTVNENISAPDTNTNKEFSGDIWYD